MTGATRASAVNMDSSDDDFWERGDWEDELPIATLRLLNGETTSVPVENIESSSGSSSSSDEDDNRVLAHIRDDEMVGNRRWVRINQDISKPDVMTEYTDTPGVTEAVDKETTKTFGDFFRLFVTLEFLSILCQRTNLYARKNGADTPKPNKKRPSKGLWKSIAPTEMLRWLSLTFLMGLIKKPSINDYWSTQPEMATPIFPATMARDRFKAILRSVYFYPL